MKICIRLLLTLTVSFFLSQPARATTYLWNVASPGANNWNVNANWLPATGNPGSADTAIFGTTGTSPDGLTVNSVVSANTTVTSLSYTNSGAGAWHVTQIPAGTTLTVSGATTIGGITSAGALAPTTVAFFDAGTLVLNGNLNMGNSGSANTVSTADFSGLSNLVCNASAGTIAAGFANRSLVTWKLAAISNSLTASTVTINALGVSSSGTANVTLGAGTNIFNVGTFNVGGGRLQSTVAFPAGSTGGGLRIRGTAGTDASLCNLTLGNHNTSGSGSTSAGTFSLNGYPVDMRLGTLTLGQSSSGPTGNSPGNGTITFDTGAISATNIVMGVSSGTTAFALANGTINVGSNGRLTVGPGGISLANQSAASGAATGTLNVNGGTVVCSNSITKASASGTGMITLSSGSLTMAGGVIGTAAVPIDSLSMGDAALTVAVSQNTTNVVVNTLTTTSSTNNTINLTSLPVITSYPVQYSILKYGSYSPVFDPDFVLGTMPAGSPAYTGYISNNVAKSTLDVVITGGPAPSIQVLTWNGTLNSGAWDASTANWQGGLIYNQGDYVTFDDTASGSTAVNLTTALAPGQLTVSNLTRSYTFNGSGSITGAVTLFKTGAAQLTLANSGVSAFTGGVTINGGKLQISGASNVLPTSGTVTLADDSTAVLDLNNLNQQLGALSGGGITGGNVTLGSGNLTVTGGGTYGGVISGTGRLIKTNLTAGGTLTLTNANTYSGGTIIGGYTNNTTLVVANQAGSGTGSSFVRVLTNGTFSLGSGGAGGVVAAGIITNDGIVRINRNDEYTLTNVIVGAGALQAQGGGTLIIPGVNSYTGGSTISLSNLRMASPGALGSGTIVVANASPAALQLTNGITLTNALILQSKPSTSGTVPNLENIDGTNTVTGPIQLTQNGANGWVIAATAGRLVIAGSVVPVPPTQTSQTASRNLLLRGDADGAWTGSIADSVNSVTNVAVRKDGLGTWTLSGNDTYSGTTTVLNGNLMVNGSVAGGAVTVTGGTLGGTGVINGAVTVSAAGTLAPGTSIGTLTINNNLTLNGIAAMEVSHTANDKVAGIGSLTLGGTLSVVVNGALTGGEVFKLFAATNYTGDFATYDLPALSSPLGWDYSSVPLDGTLKVTGGTPAPPELAFTQSGNNLNFTWSGAFKLQSQTNGLNAGLKNNWFDYPNGGTSPVGVTINPANPTVFFRLAPQ